MATDPRLISSEAEASLAGHLEDHYGIQVTGTSRLEAWSPCVHRIDHANGTPWVARLFQPARPFERVEGDAGILKFLDDQDFPAERIVCAAPVSELLGHGVLVTGFVEGTMLQDIPVDLDGSDAGAARDILQRSGDLLGRLMCLPIEGGAPAREGGSWHSHAPFEGLPHEDMREAKRLLEGIAGTVPEAHRARYDSLAEQVDLADDCSDLPRALIHPDFGGPNIIVTPPGEMVVIDWSGSGRGPRATSLGWLINRFHDFRCVDAVIDGYQKWVQLEEEELERLADAMRILPLYFACRSFENAVRSEREPGGFASDWCTEEDNERRRMIAARVSEIFRNAS